ncbi:hypothetical protein [Limnobaculum xujianqingii]|uniref:hypothetical protein n=1 Tax=Limnobaculum xujianqingii TaxID=2738837 RepID=UPI001126203B|nr:hypothetical protein [Limnobaculum xujianqingii]
MVFVLWIIGWITEEHVELFLGVFCRSLVAAFGSVVSILQAFHDTSSYHRDDAELEMSMGLDAVY